MKLRALAAPTTFLGALVAVATLGGCVSLFPKTDPAQLYRFGYRPPGPAPTCDRSRAVGVIFTPPEFPRASAADQMLTLSGEEAAYVSASRWVSPARNLFEDAVEEAFLQSCAVRLVRRQDFGAGAVRLRIDVDRFEATYPAGAPQKGKAAEAAAPPTVTVDFKATLMGRAGDFGAERYFSVTRPAGENRVGAIVAAYTAATTQGLTDLTAWTDSQAAKIAADQDGSHPTMAAPAPPLPPGAVRRSSSSTTSTTTSNSTVQTPR